jgi:transposase
VYVQSLKHVQGEERLREAALLLECENERLVKRVVALEKENLQLKGLPADAMSQQLQLLEEALALSRKQAFGKTSERQPTAAPEETPAAKPKQRGHGPTAQPKLPIEVSIHTLDKADEMCPSCGNTLKVWNGQFEESEEVDVVQRVFVIRKHKRQKYRCTCGCIETALGQDTLTPGGRYSIDFAAEVAAQKYDAHLPLERQTRLMEAEGLIVSSQTLFDCIYAATVKLRPVVQAIHAEVLAADCIGVDETTWKLLSQGKQGYLWSAVSAKAAVYRVGEGRSADEAQKLLLQYKGTVVCDGYSAYGALQERMRLKNEEPFKIAHCWAHVRRKYIDSLEAYPKAQEAIDLIGQLYAVEKDAKANSPPDSTALLKSHRNERSRPIVAKLKAWGETLEALPESSLGKARAYMRNMWQGLILFLDDVAIALDNNHTERALRGPVVGRKNHYGSRSQRGMEVASSMYTLSQTCRMLEVGFKPYLRFALKEAAATRPVPTPALFAAMKK